MVIFFLLFLSEWSDITCSDEEIELFNTNHLSNNWDQSVE